MSYTFFLQYTSQQQTSSAVCCIAQQPRFQFWNQN